MPDGFGDQLKKWQQEAESSFSQLQEIETQAGNPPPEKDKPWWKTMLGGFGLAIPPLGLYQYAKAAFKPKPGAEVAKLTKQRDDALANYSTATWFADAYSATPAGLKAAGITSFTDYMKKDPPGPTVAPAELAKAKKYIDSILLGTEEEAITYPKELAKDWITEPLETRPKFQGIHLTTVQEMIKWLSKQAPQPIVPENLGNEGLMEYLKDQGWDEEQLAEIEAQVTETWGSMFDEHRSEREQIRRYQAGIDTPQMPDETWKEKLARAGSQPALAALDALGLYWKAVEEPIAALTTYSIANLPPALLPIKHIGTISETQELLRDELKTLHKYHIDEGTNWWTAWGKAWHDLEAPEWAKISMEIVADPLNLIGFGWFTKLAHATKAIPVVGRFTGLMGAVERGWIAAAEYPLIKARAAYRRIPLTRGQKTAFAEFNSDNIITSATGQHFSSKGGMKHIPQEDFTKHNLSAIDEVLDNPETLGYTGDLGRNFLDRPPMTQDDFTDWAGKLSSSLTPADITPQTLFMFEELIESAAVRGSLRPAKSLEKTAQELLRLVFNVADSPENMKIAENLIEGIYTRTIRIAKGIASMPKAQCLRQAAKKAGKIVLTTSYADDFNFKFHHGVWSGILGEYRRTANIWANTMDKHLIMPFARAYLVTASYMPWNWGEEVMRTWFGRGGLIYGKNAPVRLEYLSTGLTLDRKIFQDGVPLAKERYRDMPKILAKEGKPGIGEMSEAVEREYGKGPLEKLLLYGWHPKMNKFHEALYFPIRGSQWAGGIERSGFTTSRWLQHLDEMAPDAVKGIKAAVGTVDDIPQVIGTTKSLRNGFYKQVNDAAHLGPNAVRSIPDKFTFKEIRLAEVAEARTKYADIGTAGDYIMSRAEIGDLWSDIPGHFTKAKDKLADNFLHAPETKMANYKTLIDDLLEKAEATPNKEHLLALVQTLRELSDDAPETIHAVFMAFGERSAGITSEAGRNALWNDAYPRIAPFLDEVEKQANRLATHIRDQSGSDILTKLQWDEVDNTITQYMNRVSKIVDTRHKADLERTILLERGVGPGTPEWQDELGKIWFEHHTVDSELAANMDVQQKILSNKITPQDIPTPRIDASGRGLTPADVAPLFLSTGDQLSYAMMQSSAMRPKMYFTAHVKKKATEMANVYNTTRQALGFTDQGISDVYDQLIYGLRSSPEFHNILTPKFAELDNLAMDIEAIRINKALDPRLTKVYKEYAEGVATKLEKLDIYKKPEPIVEPPTKGDLEDIKGFLAEPIIPKATEGMPEPWEMTKAEWRNTQLLPVTRPFSTILREGEINYTKGSVFHGTGVEAMQNIIEKESIQPLVSRGDKLGEAVVSMSQIEKVADDFGVVTIELRDRGYVERRLAWEGDWVKGMEVVSKDAIPLSDIKGVTFTLGAKEDLLWKDPISGITLDSLKKQIENKGIKVTVKKVQTHKDLIVQALKEGKPVPAHVLKDYPELGKAVPLDIRKEPTTLREGTDDWWKTKQDAMDATMKEYYHEFTDYTNANSADLFMRNVFPYWQYESQRWFWLPRNFLTHPGVFNIWGKHMDNSDYGYLHVPGTNLEFNLTRGSIYKGGMSTLVRRDYPEYYDQYFPEFFETVDYAERFGFFPNVFWGTLINTFGGREPQLGQQMPAIVRTPLDIYVAANPDSKIGKALQETLFSDRFRDYLIMCNVEHIASADQIQRNINGETIWNKMETHQTLTDEEQALWDRARQKVAMVSPLLEHGGIFRMRHQDRIEAYNMMGEFVEEITGVSVEMQDNLRRHGYSVGDVCSGLSQQDMLLLEEALEYKRWLSPRLTASLRPSNEIEVNLILSEFWNEVKLHSETNREELKRVESQAFRGEGGWISKSDYIDKARGIMSDNARFIHSLHGDKYNQATGQWESNPNANTKFSMVPVTMGERAEFYTERGVNLSMSTFDEMLAEWYQLSPKQKVDPVTNTVETDWGTYFATMDVIRTMMPDDLRREWDSYLQRNFTPGWAFFKDSTQNYLVPYWNVSDIIKQELFSTEEQALIDEYYKIHKIDPDRTQEIMDITRPDGTKLIAQYKSKSSDARHKLRLVNPMLDAQLLFWNKTTTLLTPEAEQMYNQLVETSRKLGL